MAARRPALCALALTATAAWLLLSVLAPAFAGVQQTPRRQLRVATRASDICEIFVTNPSVGMRTRMSVTPETTVETIVKDGRKALGFDQAWIEDKDFKLYKKETAADMAARRPVLGLVAAAAAVLVLLHAFAAPAFAGARPNQGRQLRVATRASDICEIFVTNPSVGMRTRMSVTPETPVDTIVKDARKALGFDQAWISDSDFKLYKKEDESTPITGKMGDHDLKPWGPEGTELHLIFQPGK
eukprot:CAMPEP_0197942782 /NCGR_PEP_ID=MMETSP1439-20131203/124585_1 /TAXON_ID=66791 /ORGANISM="Gonyaulax spinifera, Strain CCMP409" /LENGTH=241 /DNA_ID=CAMNT_0043566039 /DNA_START=81 /DNA_END=806 /DNA_ORIENTATION=-